jgi:hypothetical protein
MSQAIRAKFDPIRTLAYTLISGTFYPVGTQLDNPARAVYIYNNTDRALFFSFDGYNDHISLPAFGYWFFDIASNKTRDQGWFIAEGERLFTRTPTTNPTTGSVYFTVIYGADL